MQIIVPKYYLNFKCIAQKCKHSCCIGWEIDIDSETLEIYKGITSNLGQRLKKGIDFSAKPPHFITDELERCPFLNKNGLCDIITELGEDGLCQICYDHPRFKNYFADRVEIGLGLCCEAAAELILSSDERDLTVMEDDRQEDLPSESQSALYAERDGIFNLFKGSAEGFKAKIQRVATEYNSKVLMGDLKNLVKIYRSLERLDPKWDEILNKTEQEAPKVDYLLSKAEQEIPLPAGRLFCYFIYRYFMNEGLDQNTKGAVDFALSATVFCLAVCLSNYGELNFENFVEICRIFSLEVEYSEQNIDLILKGDLL